MKSFIKQIVSLSLIFVLAVSTVSFAETDTTSGFTDVGEDHYAKDAIDLMADYGIIEGTENGLFEPSSPVIKSAFAKMMVLTLGLELDNPSTPYFTDVSETHWAYTYVETAKFYMTFWQFGDIRRFKPDEQVVREDMAVAIVKAMGLDITNADLSILDQFVDANTISEDLKPYVAVAVTEGILQGSTNSDGGKIFMAQNTIDRAQTATMLARLITEKKVTPTEVKTTMEETEEETPGTEETPAATEGDPVTLYADPTDDDVVLTWTQGPTSDLAGYKVVLSPNVTSPSYPDQGYAVFTSQKTYTVMDGNGYNGDMSSVEGGQSYYVAITALYNDGHTVTSNVLRITVPEKEVAEEVNDNIQLTADVREDDIVLEWTEASKPISYYKVVMSETVENPMYSQDGYLAALNNNSYRIEAGQDYHNGTVGQVTAGKTYYTAITVVYKDGTKVSSNVLSLTIPENGYEEVEKTAPVLTATVRASDVLLDWTAVEGEIQYYKVVLSKGDSTPEYSANGWLTYQDATVYKVEAGQTYHSGDFSTVTSGERYYVAITVVYKDNSKMTSNVEVVTIP